MDRPTSNPSLASIVRTMPIDLNERIQATIALSRSPTTESKLYMLDFRETMRLLCRVDLFTILRHHMAQNHGIPNGIATIEQMKSILRQLVTSYRSVALIFNDSEWRKIVKETKHDLVATAIETTQERFTMRAGKILSETQIAVTFAKILQNLSNPRDVEEEDFL